MSKELQSGIREAMRTATIAFIGILLIQIQQGYIDPLTLALAFVVGILKGLERYLYKIAPDNKVSKVLSFEK